MTNLVCQKTALAFAKSKVQCSFTLHCIDESRIITEACVDSFESFFRRWSPTTSFLWAGGRKVKSSVIMHSFGYRGYRICCSLLSNPCQRMPLDIPCKMTPITKKQSRKARGCCGVGVLPECFRALGCLTLSSILLGFGFFWLRWTNDGLTWSGHEYPQQPETKTVAKDPMSVKYVYCPALLTLEVGRARRNHSTNTLWKNAFPKAFAVLWPIFPKLVPRFFFPERTAVRLTLHFIYLTYIIHISCVLYITYIFYTIFYTIFSRSTSTFTPSSSSISSTPSTSPTGSFSINFIYMTYIIYNAYMAYIITYITASSTSPTSSNLSNLTSLTTSSSSSTT